ncbi:MAG: hypothetical protein JNK21_08685 [Rhodospirillaceae bacterium]|nr:hypothetical protein [Rhodospirillaceae bacterium]
MNFLAAAASIGLGLADATPAAAQGANHSYITTAVALGQCDGQPLSMIEDIRLGVLIMRVSAEPTTLARIAEHLKDARTGLKIDCASPAVQSDMRRFTAEVRPGLTASR